MTPSTHEVTQLIRQRRRENMDGLADGVGSFRRNARGGFVSRFVRLLFLAVVPFVLLAPPAAASPEKKLAANLGALWTSVLETPADDNPFTGGDPCVRLDGVVAPVAPLGTESVTCTVTTGTRIFVLGWTSECSTVEAPPYFGTDEPSLRACARAVDAGLDPPTVTVDGRPLPVVEVETALLDVVLPADNIFGQPAGTAALSVGHGWVALLHPLPPGTHEIVIHVTGTYVGQPVDFTNTTTIIVRPGKL
jgi:hypothetical protein